MANAAATRLSGPVLSIPNYGSASPNRVKIATTRSPVKSVSISSPPASPAAAKSRQSCMCSPTNHPGSFRCSLHKDKKQEVLKVHCHSKPASTPSPPPSTVVPTGSGAGSRMLARRAIAPPPKAPQQRRATGELRPRARPSRLSAVSFAGDRAGADEERQ